MAGGGGAVWAGGVFEGGEYLAAVVLHDADLGSKRETVEHKALKLPRFEFGVADAVTACVSNFLKCAMKRQWMVTCLLDERHGETEVADVRKVKQQRAIL